jgi:hypothetical protein
MADDWITQTEAANLRGVTVAAITQLVRRGRLRTVERYGRALVSLSEVQAFEPSPGGWPKGKPRNPEKRATGPKSASNGTKGKKVSKK